MKKHFAKAVFLLSIISTLVFGSIVPAWASNEIATNRNADGAATQTLTETPGERSSYYNSLGLLDDGYDAATVIDEPGSGDERSDIRDLNVGNNLNITYRDGNGNLTGALRILIILTLVALAPLLLIMLTSFTRILVVLHFVRAAIGTQTAPPNQVLVGLTLFLTFFIMQPALNEMNTNAVRPFEAGEITQQEFAERAMAPLREFMYGQTQAKDVRLFLDIAGIEDVEGIDDIPNAILIPSFLISELRTAFIIGFLIYLPFIVIDMVVASTLMSMGMMMLPPTTVSMPFKILLFVLADGWNLVIGSLVKTFY
ncbi:MAG: flagellar type III secretion system pore protein FliP [Lachnospiraceae bacterium]|nr:flagellar type III secretion system pore protein FliP [Lachnospiraceae bacterium]